MEALNSAKIRGKKALAYEIIGGESAPLTDFAPDAVKLHRIGPVAGNVLSPIRTPADPIEALNDLFWLTVLHNRWKAAIPREFDRSSGQQIAPSTEAEPVRKRREKFERDLKDWCGKYGLLGLLPAKLNGGGLPISAQPRHFPRDDGQLVGAATRRDIQDFVDDEVFWVSYSEPVDDMMMAARSLYGVADLFAKGGTRDRAQREIYQVNHLMGGHRLLAEEDNGLVTLRWTADSVLSFLAAALMRAPGLGYRSKVCVAPDCGLVFLTQRKNKKWCPRGSCSARIWARNQKDQEQQT